MMVPCVILVNSSPFLESVGSVQNVPIMICAQFVIMQINILCVIGLLELPLQEVNG